MANAARQWQKQLCSGKIGVKPGQIWRAYPIWNWRPQMSADHHYIAVNTATGGNKDESGAKISAKGSV